ncbi:hypothetical protein QUB09_16065 [Microcoleus sp. C2C6]
MSSKHTARQINTHHLLEQAFHAFESEVKHISLPQTRLDVRVVSGTPGHCSVDKIEEGDNVLTATLKKFKFF